MSRCRMTELHTIASDLFLFIICHLSLYFFVFLAILCFTGSQVQGSSCC
jgi:hypothetical protein